MERQGNHILYPELHPLRRNILFCPHYLFLTFRLLKPYVTNDVDISFEYTSAIKTLLVKNKNILASGAVVYKIPCKDCELVYTGETGMDRDTQVKGQECNQNLK